MTNKTFGHVNHVNNSNSQSKVSQSLLSSTNRAAAVTSAAAAVAVGTSAAVVASKQSSSTLTNGNSNNIPSNSSHIKNNSSSISCPGGGNNEVNNNRSGCGGSGGGRAVDGAGIIKAYAHGIWYQEYDTIDNSVQQHIQLLQQQRQRLYNNNLRTVMSSNNLDVSSGNVLSAVNNEQQQHHQHHHQQRGHLNGLKDNRNDSNNNKNKMDNATHHPNNCDIVVVDIEDEPFPYDETPPPHRTILSQYPIKATIGNMQRSTAILRENINHRQETAALVHTGIDNVVNDGGGVAGDGNDMVIVDDNDNDNDDDIDYAEDDDSLVSMETLSDNVSIWIDGEKHWISGVDAQTTCADLIWALLYYQNGHRPPPAPPEQNLLNAVSTAAIDGKVDSRYYAERSKEHQDTIATSTKVNGSISISSSCHTITTTTTSTTNSSNTCTATTTTTTSTGNFNQSMPKNTKEENCKVTQNSSRLTPMTTTTTTSSSSANDAITATRTTMMTTTPLLQPGSGCNASVLPCAPVTTLPFPPGIATAAQLATEYVIVKQYHHCEEYLDGSTKVFDVLPPRNSQHKKECELLLRRLGPAPMSAYANNTTATPQLSSLISTDKDSGMGSPVGSARSAKFRRRKHKSSQWLAQANTLHPKLSRCTATANERLLKIILAQDETIQRQLSLLREKERQINKIEEEKHRKRERELGKNYLLETYLNGLDEAECEPEPQEGEEIFIDEPYQQQLCDQNPLPKTSSNANIMMTSHKDTWGMDMLDNFRPRDSKKDKKKKRHKDKSPNDDIKPSSTSINSRAKDKEERLLRQLYDNEMTTNIPGSIAANERRERHDDNADGMAETRSKAETEMQIFWLEKVYALNKQLQKEEELAAKLHAKIRKHQLRKANQTQKEVQLEMDKLDNSLALQCGSIRRVEANLMETNDQLQKKLLILERLSLEYLRQQEEDEQAEEGQQNVANENRAPPTSGGTTEVHTKISLNNIKSVEEVEQLQKLIAKPGFDHLQQHYRTIINPSQLCYNANGEEENHLSQMTVTALMHHHPPENERSATHPNTLANNEPHIISLSEKTALTTYPRIGEPCKLQEVAGGKPSATTTTTATPLDSIATLSSSSAAAVASIATAVPTTRTVAPSPVCLALDKNMSTSLHVQNAKTIKKQMFHSQQQQTTSSLTAVAPTGTSSTGAAGTALSTIAITSTTSAEASPANSNPNPPKAIFEINAFPPKQQQYQNFNQHMPHPLPLPFKLATAVVASSTTTSPPVTNTTQAHIKAWHANSHPAIASRIAVDPVAAAAVATSAAVASLAPIQTTMALALPASASSSSSSPASLMAMNTVDISQLGTLV